MSDLVQLTLQDFQPLNCGLVGRYASRRGRVPGLLEGVDPDMGTRAVDARKTVDGK